MATRSRSSLMAERQARRQRSLETEHKEERDGSHPKRPRLEGDVLKIEQDHEYLNGSTVLKQSPKNLTHPPTRRQGSPNSTPSDSGQSPADRVSPKRRLSAEPLDQVQTDGQEATGNISAKKRNLIGHWAEEQTWPEEYFQHHPMEHLLPRKRSTPTLRRKDSESSLPGTAASSSMTSQKPPNVKNAPYQNANYEILLQVQAKSFMREHEQGIGAESEQICQELLNTKQPIPENTIFRDDVFRKTCERLQGKNEARIMKDITPLIVPSVEPLAILGAKHLDIAVESVNEGWGHCICITNPRPQPDYSVGFQRSAFSQDQLDKLSRYIDDPSDMSYFLATYSMLFPFLACEVKSGRTSLDIADRQNAHSMTVALNGIVGLFKAVKRLPEVDRRILGFSISHDHASVSIWAHYPVVEADRFSLWRHPIRDFKFAEGNGPEKWVPYTVIRNIYDLWVPKHFKFLCSVVDDIYPLPDAEDSP